MGAVTIMGHNPEFKYLIQRYVRRSGHRAVLVDSEEELLAGIRHERPAAIIVEADTPQETGSAMLGTLRSDRLTREIPVVVCTWLDDRAHGPGREGVIYLRKPILYGDLASALVDSGVSIRAEGSVDSHSRDRGGD